MMFDKLCSLYERVIDGRLRLSGQPASPEFVEQTKEAAAILAKCPLFDFGAGIAQPDLSEEDIESLREGWFMPFDTMAIEDDQGCIVLQPVEKSQRGLKHLYYASEYRYVFTEGRRCELMRHGVIGEIRHRKQVDESMPMLPAQDVDHHNAQWAMSVGMPTPELYIIDGEGMVNEAPLTEQMKDFHRNVSIAIFEVAEINRPHNWVIKKETVKARPLQKGKIPRSDQRPRYVMVTDGELHRVLREPNPENSPFDRRPHRRRRHLRYLRSERYSEEKRFTHTVVEACWVGPQQAEYHGERYTVCLDL